jgi:hypothetical protein
MLRNKQKILILIPLAIIGCFVIYTWYNIMFSIYVATWRHYIGLIGYLILVFLFFTNQARATISIGVFLLLATFNALAITLTITTSGVTIMSISTPPVHLLSLCILVLYFILNFYSLVEINLDYKEAKELKRKHNQ